MKCVNYYILGAILGLLEGIQLIEGVDFLQFDPDDDEDVNTITSLYIQPSVEGAKPENQATIRRTIAYYTTIGAAPFQLMRDRCQELLLADADSWELFFTRVGLTLYGANFQSLDDLQDVIERLNEREGELIFTRPV
jgi:hypothetical protein